MESNSILRRPQVEEVTGLSRSTIYNLMKQGSFPAPIPLGPRSRGWLNGEIQSWIDERRQKRDSQAESNTEDK